MQFHLNGFRLGNPDISERAEPNNVWQPSDAFLEQVDVLIVGCGPAGLTLAAQLATWKRHDLARVAGPHGSAKLC